MRVRVASSGLLGLILLAGACGGSDGGGGGEAVQGTVATGVITLPASVNGAPSMSFLVDTGSPLVLVDPSRFPSLNLPSGLGKLQSLEVGGMRLHDVDFVGASPCGVMMMCRGSSPAGLLGGDVLAGAPLTIDYRAQKVWFGAPPAPPANVGAPATASFTLAGGGTVPVMGMTGTFTLPATRIIVDVDVEGSTVAMALDTGSSAMVLLPDLYDGLVADGRAQSSIDVSTVNGTESEPTAKLRSVAVAGSAQSDVDAIRSPLDLSALQREIGRPIQGLLGGSYLQRYFVTIDYPARQLTLRGY